MYRIFNTNVIGMQPISALTLQILFEGFLSSSFRSFKEIRMKRKNARKHLHRVKVNYSTLGPTKENTTQLTEEDAHDQSYNPVRSNNSAQYVCLYLNSFCHCDVFFELQV